MTPASAIGDEGFATSQVVQPSDQVHTSSASQMTPASVVRVDAAADITAYVQASELSERKKILLVTFLTHRPHFGALRSEVANVFASNAQKANLKAFDDVLCGCLMLQTTAREMEAFRVSIQLFAMKYSKFSKAAKALMKSCGFTLESLDVLLKGRMSSFLSLCETDAWKNAIKRYGWMLASSIDILSSRTHHLGRQADCQLLHWILKANHIPAATIDTRGDGNCFLYSTYGAILAAIGQSGGINNETFAKALRWLVIVHAHQFCGDAVTEELKLLHHAHTDPDDSSAVDNSHCDPHAFMPRMCLLFQMNMRVLRANRRRDADGNDEWHLECLQYTFRSRHWNDWVRTRSLAGKIPFLEWDPVQDADAINEFKEMGGVYAFIYHSDVYFDGDTLSRGQSAHHERQTADISNAVPMLLGKSDPQADTTDQLIIAMVSCDIIGHYCCLRGENVQSLRPARHEELRKLVDKLKQTWTKGNDEAKRIEASVKKSEQELQKQIAKEKKEEEKRMAKEARMLSRQPSEDPMPLSQSDSLPLYETEAVHALSRMGLDDSCTSIAIGSIQNDDAADSEAIAAVDVGM